MQTKFLSKRSTRSAIILTVIAAAIVAIGLATRGSQAKRLEEGALERTIPTVSLIAPSLAANGTLELPARVEPWARAPIYARVGGYLARWHADIGTAVKAGQLLATIDTPDLDQQLLQAEAELASARSNLTLAESTSKRWTALLAEDAVSRQEADERSGDLAARRSAMQALAANVQRIRAMKGYARLVAPFDGVVTARNTDVGALIDAGGGAGSELFVVSDIRRLRVYVQVPQRHVAVIRPGSRAQLNVPERQGQEFAATVQAQAQAIDSSTGAMLVQLAVDNADAALLPGAFATVRFDTPKGHGGLSVPPGALILGKNGAHVATVDKANRVRLKQVTIARDLGNAVQLASGIEQGERVIDNPPDGIANGEQVRVAALEPKVAP